MNKPKFTPGPWEAIPGNSMVRVNPLVDQGYLGGLYIADIQLLLPEAEANANLIAAAPEMYEALEKVAEYGDCFAHKTGERNPYRMVMEALKKARGEE